MLAGEIDINISCPIYMDICVGVSGSISMVKVHDN